MDFNSYYFIEDSCSYKLGNCEVFAIALSELLNKPLYVVRGFYWDNNIKENVYEDCHVVVKVSNNNYMDVDGIKNEEEIKLSCMFLNDIKKIKLIKITKEEAKFIFSTEGILEKDIEKAKQIILQNKSKYGL